MLTYDWLYRIEMYHTGDQVNERLVCRYQFIIMYRTTGFRLMIVGKESTIGACSITCHVAV